MRGRHASRPPRVLFITGAYAPEISAGGLQCQAVAQRLGGRINCQVLTTTTDPSLPARGFVDGVAVSRVGVDLSRAGGSARATPRMLKELVRLVPQVDLVHVQGFSQKNVLVSLVAKAFGRSVIISLQTSKHDEPAAVAAQSRLAWWAFSTAGLYLSVSPALEQAWLNAGLTPGRIRQVPNGVDLVRFSPLNAESRAAVRRRLKLPNDRPLVLSVGTLARDKQPHLLFEAWRQLQADASRACTLVYVGATSPRQFEADASLAEEIRREADRLGVGDRVIFVAPTHEVHDYYRAADIFVLASAREGLPIALLEAMACGLPSVASRLPGSTDVLITHELNGLLVPPTNASGFATALAGLLAHPAEAARMGAAARQRAEERFSMDRVAEAWLEAYQDVLASNR